MSEHAGAPVVVGVDGSRAALDAARWAAGTAVRLDAPLLLAHTYPDEATFYNGTAMMIDAQFIQELREDGNSMLDATTAAVLQDHPGLAVERDVRSGAAASHLIELSRAARIVALGAQGAGAVTDYLLGSTVLRTVNHAHSPVAVVRGEPATAAPDTRPIVVGVDGSQVSEKAVEEAFALASAFGVGLDVVHAWSGEKQHGLAHASKYVDWTAYEEGEKAIVSECLAGIRDEYPDVPVNAVTTQGVSADVLLRHATRAQLLVVGSHGRGKVLGALLGSVSQNLVHHAPCPVLVCRARQ
ncbi:universal stress protein [Rhodococcus opacus]|uniref:Universal stress protein n=1 Tax=Rhodococcus opacus TaxID=37919 RepID=A0AAX3Y9M0_RHOOP|nr:MULTISPECIES: universal stress protein [Rhodococcus]ELB94734.1 universal stress protein [Rhodococcus wratislaviensis IFP 2016]MCZ4589739.1 universal stress protein [Rhodococcus opacus]QDQ94400.1 universal stress protein [Rhodococcus sp. WB9]UZG54307.1 universal stress protein [Rhodococcus opacus]WKN54655.1 universal stress protein [Rhodococcus opacus]